MQVQEQVQEIPTIQQSLNVVKNILRTGLSTICYIRQIFEDDNFASDRVMGTFLE